jgi:hypothetical protein
MKKPQLTLTLLLLPCIIAGLVCRVQAKPYVVQLTSGSINWMSGVVTTSGLGGPTKKGIKNLADTETEIFSAAMQNAGQNLFEIIKQIRINADKRVGDLAAEDATILIKAREMVYAAKEVENLRKLRADGTFELFLQFNLHGGFAQLVLPKEIEHVESLTQVLPGKESPSAGIAPEVYTGLIVDARTTGANPAMAPKVLDENGQEVYGTAFVSREYAVQNGMSAFMSTLEDAEKDPRVGHSPLIVKGLKAEGAGQSDIVISNTDAAKLRKSSDNLLFLKQCRVIIVLCCGDK